MPCTRTGSASTSPEAIDPMCRPPPPSSRPKTQRTAKPSSPRGSSQVAWTSSTRAPDGPRPHHATIDSTASRRPSKTASTAPSGRFATQPATSSERARRLVSSRKKTPWTRPLTTTLARASAGKPLLADEGHEAARNGMDHRRPLRAPHDHLELLRAPAADRHDEPPARLELLVERRRELGHRGGDGDRVERRAVGDAERAVAVAHRDARVPGRREVPARELGELRDPLDRHHL